MKNLKTFALAALAALPCALFAGEANSILKFGTTGPDTYADGQTVVLDGECYALVWTKAGAAFGGVKVDGTAVDADNNMVVGIFPIAKDGKCPENYVEVEPSFAKKYGDGSFGLVLLDTRKSDGTVSVKDGKFDAEGGRVNGYVATNAKVELKEGVTVRTTSKAVEPVAVASVSEIPGYLDQQCVITGIRTDKEFAYITVAGTNGKIDYGVSAGETADAAGTGKADKSVQAGADGAEITFKVPKQGLSGFFRVDRAPLK